MTGGQKQLKGDHKTRDNSDHEQMDIQTYTWDHGIQFIVYSKLVPQYGPQRGARSSTGPVRKTKLCPWPIDEKQSLRYDPQRGRTSR